MLTKSKQIFLKGFYLLSTLLLSMHAPLFGEEGTPVNTVEATTPSSGEGVVVESTSTPESEPSNEQKVYKSSTTTLSEPSNAQQTSAPTFESIKLGAISLKTKVSTTEKMTRSALEAAENSGWWPSFIFNSKKTAEFFDSLRNDAKTAFQSGSEIENMSWWNDLKLLNNNISTMLASETDKFKIGNLENAKQAATDIESLIDKDLRAAIALFNGITGKVVEKIELIEKAMSSAQNLIKQEPSKATRDQIESAKKQRANQINKDKEKGNTVTRSPQPTISRGSIPTQQSVTSSKPAPATTAKR